MWVSPSDDSVGNLMNWSVKDGRSDSSKWISKNKEDFAGFKWLPENSKLNRMNKMQDMDEMSRNAHLFHAEDNIDHPARDNPSYVSKKPRAVYDFDETHFERERTPDNRWMPSTTVPHPFSDFQSDSTYLLEKNHQLTNDHSDHKNFSPHQANCSRPSSASRPSTPSRRTGGGYVYKGQPLPPHIVDRLVKKDKSVGRRTDMGRKDKPNERLNFALQQQQQQQRHKNAYNDEEPNRQGAEELRGKSRLNLARAKERGSRPDSSSVNNSNNVVNNHNNYNGEKKEAVIYLTEVDDTRPKTSPRGRPVSSALSSWSPGHRIILKNGEHAVLRVGNVANEMEGGEVVRRDVKLAMHGNRYVVEGMKSTLPRDRKREIYSAKEHPKPIKKMPSNGNIILIRPNSHGSQASTLLVDDTNVEPRHNRHQSNYVPPTRRHQSNFHDNHDVENGDYEDEEEEAEEHYQRIDQRNKKNGDYMHPIFDGHLVRLSTPNRQRENTNIRHARKKDEFRNANHGDDVHGQNMNEYYYKTPMSNVHSPVVIRKQHSRMMQGPDGLPIFRSPPVNGHVENASGIEYETPLQEIHNISNRQGLHSAYSTLLNPQRYKYMPPDVLRSIPAAGLPSGRRLEGLRSENSPTRRQNENLKVRQRPSSSQDFNFSSRNEVIEEHAPQHYYDGWNKDRHRMQRPVSPNIVQSRRHYEDDHYYDHDLSNAQIHIDDHYEDIGHHHFPSKLEKNSKHVPVSVSDPLKFDETGPVPHVRTRQHLAGRQGVSASKYNTDVHRYGHNINNIKKTIGQAENIIPQQETHRNVIVEKSRINNQNKSSVRNDKPQRIPTAPKNFDNELGGGAHNTNNTSNRNASGTAPVISADSSNVAYADKGDNNFNNVYGEGGVGATPSTRLPSLNGTAKFADSSRPNSGAIGGYQTNLSYSENFKNHQHQHFVRQDGRHRHEYDIEICTKGKNPPNVKISLE